MAGTGSVESPPETTKADAAVAKVRPLNATQARALTKLVENDYQILRAEMRQFHDETIEARVKEMRAEATLERQEEFRTKVVKLKTKYNADIEKLKTAARAAGLTISVPWLSGDIQVKDEVLEKRISAYRHQSQREFDTLMLTVQRQELSAKRRVLISSITTDAEEILASIPTAKELMIQLYAEEPREIAAP